MLDQAAKTSRQTVMVRVPIGMEVSSRSKTLTGFHTVFTRRQFYNKFLFHEEQPTDLMNWQRYNQAS
jgi:hypothetical protein